MAENWLLEKDARGMRRVECRWRTEKSERHSVLGTLLSQPQSWYTWLITKMHIASFK